MLFSINFPKAYLKTVGFLAKKLKAPNKSARI